MGAVFCSVTTTVSELVALRGGTPLSVTMVSKTLVAGPSASEGVQVITPFVSIKAPGGAPVRE